MYNHMAPILRTITRDKVTQRAGDIKPGEEVQSIFDQLSSMKVVAGAINPRDPNDALKENDPRLLRKILYNEADAFEDAVLFPDELVTGEVDGAFEQVTNNLNIFEKQGPSLARWVVGAEFDEDLSDYSKDDDGDTVRRGPLDLMLDKYSSDNDDSSDYETENVVQSEVFGITSKAKKSKVQQKSLPAFDAKSAEGSMLKLIEQKSAASGSLSGSTKKAKKQDKQQEKHKDGNGARSPLLEYKGPENAIATMDKFRGTKHGWENGFASIIHAEQTESYDIVPLCSAWLDDMFENEEWAMSPAALIDRSPRNPVFIEWMEKDRSVPFREMFHKVDPAPFDQQWKESIELVKAIEAWEIGDLKRAQWVISVLIELGVGGKHARRRAYRDMARAFAQVSIAFPNLPTYSMTKFLTENEVGQKFKGSLLLDPTARAKMVPRCRSRWSCQTRPDEFFKDWIDVKRQPGDNSFNIPLAWDATIRPLIAKLYKEGVLAPAHQPSSMPDGQAVALKEPGSDQLDLYVCYHSRFRDGAWAHVENPSKWPDIKKECKAYAAAEPKAKFALIRIHSTPYFYPLMLGMESRQKMSFTDCIGRTWCWKFMPKDFSGSEMSIHYWLYNALDKYRKELKVGTQVRARRDMVLVMGKDEEDLAELCMGVCYVIHSRPWIREVDLWKSFINVDLNFIEGLDEWWVE